MHQRRRIADDRRRPPAAKLTSSSPRRRCAVYCSPSLSLIQPLPPAHASTPSPTLYFSLPYSQISQFVSPARLNLGRPFLPKPRNRKTNHSRRTSQRSAERSPGHAMPLHATSSRPCASGHSLKRGSRTVSLSVPRAILGVGGERSAIYRNSLPFSVLRVPVDLRSPVQLLVCMVLSYMAVFEIERRQDRNAPPDERTEPREKMDFCVFNSHIQVQYIGILAAICRGVFLNRTLFLFRD